MIKILKTLFNTFKLQIIGVINLTLPIIAIAYYYPLFLQNNWGISLCSIAIGLYVFFLNYKATKKNENAFLFIPTGACKEEFEKTIQECNLNPQTINLRYGYSNEGLAMTIFSTIIIDPLIWHDLDEDPEALKVKGILATHIIPTLSDTQKNRINKTKEAFTSGAQRFIFKHELGHIFYNYSNKKLFLMSILGAIATWSGIYTTMVTLKYLSIFAIPFGMFVGGLNDLFLMFLSNLFFKAQEEKKSDIFAAYYSSKADINDAADFFEKHQMILDANPEPNNIFSKFPSVLMTGHPHGIIRSRYLREFTKKNMLS